jgi:hypothetical protein
MNIATRCRIVQNSLAACMQVSACAAWLGSPPRIYRGLLQRQPVTAARAPSLPPKLPIASWTVSCLKRASARSRHWSRLLEFPFPSIFSAKKESSTADRCVCVCLLTRGLSVTTTTISTLYPLPFQVGDISITYIQALHCYSHDDRRGVLHLHAPVGDCLPDPDHRHVGKPPTVA